MKQNDGSKYLNIVMFEPEIPQNTGNVARLCACTNAKLYLIGRLGFSMNDKYLKRSGLDYWDKVEIEHIIDFEEFENMFAPKLPEGTLKNSAENPDKNSEEYLAIPRFHFFTTKTDKVYTDVQFKEGDFLIFGPETRGLPEEILAKYNKNCVTIPMNKNTRSLNLSNSIAIGAYEAIRQFGGIKG